MPRCWLAIPSCRPVAEAAPRLAKWKQQGFAIALLRQGDPIDCDMAIPTDRYLGWARSTNILCKWILERDPEMRWCCGGGDDTIPDLAHTSEEIADQCEEHFGGTFGVMQCTGWRYGDSPVTRSQFGADRGALIDRIAGSPFMGREWIRRSFGGNGPMWAEFGHMYADEHLMCCAEKLGVFWQRRDLIHEHQHWGLTGDRSKMPAFLEPVNTKEHWRESKALFDRLKAGGFQECKPLTE